MGNLPKPADPVPAMKPGLPMREAQKYADKAVKALRNPPARVNPKP